MLMAEHLHVLRAAAALQVLIVDMWKEHTPYPWNTMPDSYSFLVKHGLLWRLAYTSIQPRMVHVPYFAAMRAFIGRHLAEAFDRWGGRGKQQTVAASISQSYTKH
jgi:hypothetical protein